MTDRQTELDPSTAITIGRVAAAHGVRGELQIELLTDFPERFATGATVWLGGRPCAVEQFRLGPRRAYLKLTGVEGRAAAEALTGVEIQIPPDEAPLAEGLYHVHDVVGLRVEALDGRELGRVAEVLRTGANDVYVVDGAAGRLLLPAIEDVVREIDVAAGRMVVELLEGLEFQPPKRPSARGRHQRSSATPG